MRRRKPVNLTVNHERWLVSYADFITLLFALFVVMYSMSQVNESKYRVLSKVLLETFSPDEQIMRSHEPIQFGEAVKSVDPTMSEFDIDEIDTVFSGKGSFNKSADFPQLAGDFTQEFGELVEDELISFSSNEYWLQIDIQSSILFDSASASPSNEAIEFFVQMAKTLKKYNNPIQVEGYTDDIPINTDTYPSNWELSSARAAAVVRLLVEGGVSPERLSAVGFGGFQPIAKNDSTLGRLQNRRVVLMMAKEQRSRPVLHSVDDVKRASGENRVDESQPYPQVDLPTSIQYEQLESDVEFKQSDHIETERIIPVKTEKGGLLFSSDPGLPRK